MIDRVLLAAARALFWKAGALTWVGDKLVRWVFSRHRTRPRG